MSGQSRIAATPEQHAELRALARSCDREEADRARSILLSLEGWTSDRIAAAFGVQPDSVRHWRWIFGREGANGLRARKAPEPEPKKARAALSVVEELLAPGYRSGRTGSCRAWPTRSRSAPASASRNRASAWC